jgi:hypothetical protein
LAGQTFPTPAVNVDLLFGTGAGSAIDASYKAHRLQKVCCLLCGKLGFTISLTAYSIPLCSHPPLSFDGVVTFGRNSATPSTAAAGVVFGRGPDANESELFQHPPVISPAHHRSRLSCRQMNHIKQHSRWGSERSAGGCCPPSARCTLWFGDELLAEVARPVRGGHPATDPLRLIRLASALRQD